MNDLKARTKKFALDVIRSCSSLPQKLEIQLINRQLLRAATSVASNYRPACRGKSRAGFINKLSIVEEEADESAFWPEMLSELGYQSNTELHRLLDEAHQLTKIMVSSKKAARSNSQHHTKR